MIPLQERLKKRFGEDALIRIYEGDITDEDFSKLWKEILDAINEKPDQHVVLILTTGGGSFDAARDFYSKVKFFNVNLTTIGVGRVWSAGVTVVLAGKERLAAKNTDFFLHPSPVDAETEISRNEVEKLLALSRQCDAEEMEILAENLKISRDEIQKMIDAETYFEENRALEIGLIHKII